MKGCRFEKHPAPFFIKIQKMCMKTARRQLYETIKGKKPLAGEEPLKNIRNALGSVGYARGNPLTKTEITITVELLFYNFVTGANIAPAALPANLQTDIPVFLFGLTDFWGGFRRMQELLPPSGNWERGQPAFTASFPYAIFNVNGDIPISNTWSVSTRPGDMLQHYNDIAIPVTNVLAAIRIRSDNVAYGTFLNSFASDLITIDSFRYITPAANPTQLDNPFIFAYQSLFGKTIHDQIDPRMFTFSTDFQGNLVDIPLDMPIDKSMMMGFRMNFDCPSVSFILFVKKVEKLTHP